MSWGRLVGTALAVLVAGLAVVAALGVSAASSWERKPDMPVANGVRFLYQSPLEIGGRLYVVYGRVHEYDPAARSWKSFPNPLPTPRNHHGTAAVDGRIYTLGGGLPGDVRLDTVEEFDPATGVWRTRAPMPGPRRNMGAADVAGNLFRHCWAAQVVNGRIYILGNVNREESPDGALDEYDPATDTIVACRPLPRARNAFAAAVADGRIVVLGGQAPDNLPLDLVDAYDPATRSWSAGPTLAQARRFFGAITLGRELHVLGGLTTRDWDRPDAGMWAIDIDALRQAERAGR